LPFLILAVFLRVSKYRLTVRVVILPDDILTLTRKYCWIEQFSSKFRYNSDFNVEGIRQVTKPERVLVSQS